MASFLLARRDLRFELRGRDVGSADGPNGRSENENQPEPHHPFILLRIVASWHGLDPVPRSARIGPPVCSARLRNVSEFGPAAGSKSAWT